MKRKKRNKEHERRVLLWLGLPPNLLRLIKEGTLEKEVLKARAENERLNALMDEWELNNPDRYRLCPWYEAREEWKRMGRPAAPWYELLSHPLRLSDGRLKVQPIGKFDVNSTMLRLHQRDLYARRKAEKQRLRSAPST